MIAALSLQNFKCFRKAELPFKRLTLLTGLNGMGKSSVIQALLILRQSHLSGDLREGRLLLSGELTSLGTGADVLFEDADEDVLRFSLEMGASEQHHQVGCQFAYRYDRKVDRLEAVDPLHDAEQSKHEVFSEPPFGGMVFYIEAERYGPRKLLPLSETRALRLDVGTRGEFVLHVILEHGQALLGSDDPRLKRAASSRLLDQVEAWLHEVSPGAHLDVEAIRNADSAVGGYKFDREGDISSKRFRATNVGFGLSYALPVIVALLVSPPGALVIIENPEAHMHPKGQTRLGQLAARAAAAGVQVIVETHSDHFMDGIRIDIGHGFLNHADAAFHFFRRMGKESVFESPTIDANGRLSEWPSGFFDQHDLNLAQLIGGLARGSP